jgi:glycosyltransferase involved in cell wall biosynthesis
MIFLDADRFLDEAIASVLDQSYTAWELLLVDDGSTDGSTRIARAHAQRQPYQVTYLEHPGHQNRGMSASRNLGLAAARGEYVAFLDADDVYLPEKLETQVACLRRQPRASLAYGSSEHWFSWSGRPKDADRDFSRPLGVQAETLLLPPVLVRLLLERRALPPGICGYVARRSAALGVGGFEDRFRGLYEDQVFFYKLCLASAVYVVPGTLERYRQHPDSLVIRMKASSAGRRQARQDHRRFLEWLEGYLVEHGVRDERLWRSLRCELRPYRRPLRHHLSISAYPRRLARLRRRMRSWLRTVRVTARAPRR